jgi:hypothetical protein
MPAADVRDLRTYPRSPECGLSSDHLVLIKGRSREALRERDEARRPRASFAVKRSGGSGAPPGATTSPCQELAETCSCAIALCVTRRAKKSGVRCRRRRDWRAARRPPWSYKDRGTIGFALLGAPPPLRGRCLTRAGRERAAATHPHVITTIVPEEPRKGPR